MPGKKHHPILTLFLILSLLVNLLNIQTVRADDETPTEPPPTQIVTEPPVEETPPVVESTPVPAEATPTSADATPMPLEETATPVEPESSVTPVAEILTQIPEGTAVVVLDESGNPLPLATQEAAEIVEVNDPMWCPAGVLPGGAGCSASYTTVSALVANMVSNTSAYTQNGIIYFTATADATLSLTSANLGGAFTTLSMYDLTLQGGWNGDTVAPSFSGQTSFAGFSINIGTNGNPWVGNVTINDISFDGSGNKTPVTVYTTTGDITLSNMDVNNQQNNVGTGLLSSTSGDITVQNGSTFDGDTSSQSRGFSATTASGSITISDTAFTDANRTGNPSYDGATLSAPTVTLTNVTATGSDGDGITINNVNVATLNNVTASNNGNAGGAAGLPGNDGSGVLVNGTAGSSVIINGGTFNNNQEYGVQVGSTANTTIYIQTAPTCTNNVSNLDPAVNSCYNDTFVVDGTAPIITPIVSGTAGANGWYTSDVSVNWTVTDAESGILSSNGCTASNLTTETSGSVVTCSATNNARLSNSASVTIKIDKTGPSAALAVTAGTLGSNGWYISDVTLQTSGTDSLSIPVVCTADQFQTTETAGTAFNGSCTNNAGLTTNAAPVTVKLDKTAPTASLSVTAGTLGTNGWYTSDVTIHASGIDSTSAPVTCTADQFQTTETAGTAFNGSCANAAGLAADAAPLTIKLDKTDPIIAFVSRTAANGNGWNNTDVTVNWSCTDVLSGAVSPNVNDIVTSEGAGQSSTGTCTDNAGNTASDTQTGINIDKTAPTLTLPADITAEATSATGAVVNYSATVTDNLDALVTVNCSPASGSPFSLGTTTVNCSSTDAADNTATGSFQVTVDDSIAPVIAGHADETAEATSAAGATVVYTSPTTTDAFDGAGTATCNPASGSPFALGATTVTCTATDSNGNAATPTTFTVHVVDTTGPTLNLPANITANATGPFGATVTYSASATDIVDGPVTAICSPASGSTFPLGPTTINCSATDSHTNLSSGSFVINVQDADGPTITLPANITTEATGPSGAVVNYSASALDAVDGPRPVTCVPVSGYTFALGTTTVNCSASDLSAHTTNAAFLITVEDTTAPVIAGHADETAEATSAAGAAVAYTSPATFDTFDGAGTATCAPASGSQFVLGDTMVTCTATDSNGNAATPTTFTVHVGDTTAPTIAPHADITINTLSSVGIVVTFTSPATSDTVDGAGTATCLPASGSVFPIGNTQVTCSAVDSNGNSATSTFVVHVINIVVTPPTPPAPTPEPPSSTTTTTVFTIPVTGGGLIDLACLTTINAFDVEVIFHNLCDHQATVTEVTADALPDKLPAGYSFVKGLDVLVLNQGQIVKALPDGAGTQMVFPIPGGIQDQFDVLYWNDEDGDGTGEWVRISQTIKSDKLSQTMSVNPEDELYQITLDTLEKDIYKILTTEQTGIFVLVKK